MINENSSTRDAILGISKVFDPKSGVSLVCAYENRILLSRVHMGGMEVLELGCGCLPACFGIDDKDMPSRYLATDSEKDLIAAARQIDPRPEFRVVSALNPGDVDRSFDLIILRGVLHHLPDPSNALASLAPLLKPKGTLLLYEPNLSCLPGNLAKWVLKRFFNVVLEESPYGQLPQATIRRAVREAGLEITDEWYASLLAFPLTGDYGRKPILPNSRTLFQFVIWMDAVASKILHTHRVLARSLHWRVIFRVQKSGVLPRGKKTSI